jgi:hypothetical protein
MRALDKTDPAPVWERNQNDRDSQSLSLESSIFEEEAESFP